MLTDRDAYGMLNDYTMEGVQVVSPLTLSHKVELIKTGVHALKLSEQANKVRDDLAKLAQSFKKVDEEWRVLYGTHLKRASGKADDLDQAYGKLRDEFDRIESLTEETSSRSAA